MDDWVPPAEFDEYRVLRLLGSGAMGRVYLVHDSLLDRPVAVKFIGSGEPDRRDRRRFLVEARAIARLQHPNVVAIHRVGVVEDRPYLVTELVRGASLRELARPVPWRRALHIGRGLARGLAAAHCEGVLHRDVKPANVMVAPGDEVKLLDFGLAKLSDGADEAARVVVGTLRYMAPEVRRGEPATGRSDVYSLGAVLHELCDGGAIDPALRAVV